MREIPLAAVPNQSLTVTFDGVRYALALKTTRGVLACDIAINGTAVLSGSRVLAGEMLIPYRYIETGNFVLLTVDDELPDWRQLGVSQTLVFLAPAELEAIRG